VLAPATGETNEMKRKEPALGRLLEVRREGVRAQPPKRRSHQLSRSERSSYGSYWPL
jgi:hypothetical protein